jgi:hypothetical protein
VVVNAAYDKMYAKTAKMANRSSAFSGEPSIV